MKRLALAFVALFLSACAAIGGIPVSHGLVAPPDGSLFPGSLHNTPVTLTGFTTDRNLFLPFSNVNDPIPNTANEYYWITNSGDPTTKPNLIFKGSVAGYTFTDSMTGLPSDNVKLAWGSTVVISQENGASKNAMVTKYEAPVPPAIANTTVAGVVKSGADINVATTGLMSISNTANPTLAGATVVVKANVPVIMAKSLTSASGASTTLGGNATLLQIGAGEFGLNSYRLIGFGFRKTTENQPAFIGYQETDAGVGTMGDIVMGARPNTNNASALSVLLRVRADGQILVPNAYVPSTAGSLTSKSYVDGATATFATKKYVDDAIAVLPTKAYVDNAIATNVQQTTLTQVKANGSFSVLAPNGIASFSGTTTAATMSGKSSSFSVGHALDMMNIAPQPVVVTFTEKVTSNRSQDSKTITLNSGNSIRCAWAGTTDGWLCW